MAGALPRTKRHPEEGQPDGRRIAKGLVQLFIVQGFVPLQFQHGIQLR